MKLSRKDIPATNGKWIYLDLHSKAGAFYNYNELVLFYDFLAIGKTDNKTEKWLKLLNFSCQSMAR